MRIVIAAHGTERYSGIPKYSYLLAIALAKKGIDVLVILDSSHGQHKLQELCSNDADIRTSIVSPPVGNSLSMAKYSWNLARYLAGNRDFDILHTSHVTPYFYLRRRHRKPVVFQPFGNELFTLAGKGLNSLYCKLAQPILRYCGNKADVLVSEGEFQHADMAKWYRRPESELRVLPIGIDLPSLPVKRTYTRQAVVKFLAVNSLYRYEGMNSLIEALKIAHRASGNISLTIVGTGPLEKHLKKKTDRYPVRFLKELSELQLGKLYADSDVFVCTSRETDYQMGVLEAMAVGLPILSAPPREWLPPEAVQVSLGNLASAMKVMATWTSEEAAVVGKAMHWTATQYDFKEIADKAVKIYEGLL